MTILITYPDRADEATQVTRLAIAHELINAGHEVDIYPCGRTPRIEDYEAVLVGSTAGHHHWPTGAVSFLREHVAELAVRPTYLFQIADTPGESPEPPHDLLHLLYRIGIAGPHIVHEGADEQDQAAAWGRRIARDLDNRVEGLSSGVWPAGTAVDRRLRA